MEKFDFDISLKNIPIPTKKVFMRQMINKTENFVSRIRWATDVFTFPDKYKHSKENYGFKSTHTAPVSPLLKPFEDDLYDLIANLEYNEYRSAFQNKMAAAVAHINKSNKVFLFGDKTTNIYEVSTESYDKLLNDNITKDYKLVEKREGKPDPVKAVDEEARHIAERLGIADRVEIMSRNQAFITIKDHKPNFETNTKCRLINPAKSQIGIISRQILQAMNTELRTKLKLNQWQSTQDVLTWFKGIQPKRGRAFLQCDIVEYYPSISENLLNKALSFAGRKGVLIDEKEADIIRHSRKAFLFSENNKGELKTWQKTSGEFDVTMGAPDGAEVCELVGLFLLSEVKRDFPLLEFGLYRDDGLAVHGRLSKRDLERTQQNLRELFAKHGLRVTFENPHNTMAVNFLDVTLDLGTESYKPYRKPNDRPLYVHVDSNHPPNVLKQIPLGINKRLANISSSKEAFEKAIPAYQKALGESGYKHKLEMPTESATDAHRNAASRKQKRRIIYYNPPFNMALKTKFGKKFLELVSKHFPRHHKLYPILNRNTLKISYSCTANIKRIIQGHNKKVLKEKRKTTTTEKECNCQASRKKDCPLNGKCNRRNVVYKATTQNADPHFYIGVTENFKPRWYHHKQTFKNPELKNSTALSIFTWDRNLGEEPKIQWEIIDSAQPYVPGQRECQLCLTEKLQILQHHKQRNCLNKRNEMVQICRHKASHRLGRVSGVT